jgi:hypothetical protein
MKWLLKSAIVVLATVALYEVILSQSPDTSEKPKQNSAAADKPAPTTPPFHPNAVAKSLTAAPGAVVCADLQTVSVMFHLYAAHWGDSSADAMTKGQARVVRGPAAPAPDPKLYGCSLLVPGTPVRVENVDAFTTGFPRVTAKLPDGTVIRGVTLSSMLSLVKPGFAGTELPELHNSPDAHCNSLTSDDYAAQCTDAQFVEALGDLRKQWAIVPEWLQLKCASNSTLPSMEKCIIHETETWLNTNPNGEAPWINPDNWSK